MRAILPRSAWGVRKGTLWGEGIEMACFCDNVSEENRKRGDIAYRVLRIRIIV